MLALQQQLAAAKLEHEQTALKRQIAATDRRIDQSFLLAKKPGA
jgi:multidrug efflux pump subunit AcrA (membrane-fusion protein)